jgi:hypothetical protein
MIAKIVAICGLIMGSLLLAVFLLRRDHLPWDDIKFMEVEELRSGMRGIGKTVFSGTKVENFNVEILGVLENVWPKGDLILVRTEGGPLKKTGIISGMSGSPIYIEGRLIGALAFAWPFAREAIAGVTPIKDMLSVWEVEKDTTERDASLPWNQPLTGEGEPGPFTLKPLPSPLTLSGFDPKIIREMAPIFGQFGFLVTQGGGRVAREKEEAPLVPGAAVGVSLIKGDLNATAIGTLTYRRGDKILALGHPMLFAGTTDLPLSGAYIHALMPSQVVSFKLGSSTRTVGRISQDRRAAIAGEVGNFARMIPFEVRLKEGGTVKNYNFEIVHDRLLTPLLFQLAASNVILTRARQAGATSFCSSLTIHLRGREPLIIENTYSHPVSVLHSVGELTNPFNLLINNIFEEVKVERVSLEVEMREKKKTAEILGLRLNKNEVGAGESIEVTISLKPFEEDLTLKTVSLTLPEDTPQGQLIITVSDALTAYEKEKKRVPLELQPQNIDQLIKLIEEQDRNNEIIIRLILPQRGAIIAAEELPALPASVLAVMRASPEAGWGEITVATNLIEKKLHTLWVISPAIHSLPITVKGRIGGTR